MSLPTEPVEIRFKRWKHRAKGYVVEVLQVRHNEGEHGFHSTVLARRLDTDQELSWSAQVFTRDFDRHGTQTRESRSVWDHLVDES